MSEGEFRFSAVCQSFRLCELIVKEGKRQRFEEVDDTPSQRRVCQPLQSDPSHMETSVTEKSAVVIPAAVRHQIEVMLARHALRQSAADEASLDFTVIEARRTRTY